MQAQLGTTPAEITHSMADAMRQGDDTEQKLLLRGFTRREITEHGPAAIELANSQSERNTRVRVPSRKAA